MLELNGIPCSAEDAGKAVPLLVGDRLLLQTRSGVLAPASQLQMDDGQARPLLSISNYDLIRDLPSVYNAVVEHLHQL
jgi:hypothetical protein